MNKEFYVNGNISERITHKDVNYKQWEVKDKYGNMLCRFYGPSSASAAMQFCQKLREKGEDVIYSQITQISNYYNQEDLYKNET